MSSFPDDLQRLCEQEAVRAMSKDGDRARMITALAIELTNAIAVTTGGYMPACRELCSDLVKTIPQMVHQKAGLVRMLSAEEAGRA